MIHVYGTSHVSQESLELIEEKIEEHDPDTVALELDFMRLNALLSEEDRGSGPIFIRIIKKFQDMIGSKTGVMPGEEMLYAYQKALDDGRDVALIDQEIKDTIRKIKGVRRVEKARAVAQLVAGLFIPGSFDVSEIPEEDFLEEILEEFQFKFPELYHVLVEERNKHMVAALKNLQEENPEQDIVAFVGAAHQKAIQEEVDNLEVTEESSPKDKENVKGLQRFE
jgi:pheromone shutdown protein TraB